MNIFIDTSAFLAVLNSNDLYHNQAADEWQEILTSESILFTSNYIILETCALLQHRHGLQALQIFTNDIAPVVNLLWIDEVTHKQGLSALMVANRRDLSLVDCTSFEIIRQNGLDAVFTFDPHFEEQGFNVLPIRS